MPRLHLKAYDLSIDECSFTGETEPAPKRVESISKVTGNGITDRHNLAFMGTLVRCGNGKVATNVRFLRIIDDLS